MKAKLYPTWLLPSLALLLSIFTAEAQISGKVFRDINNDGIQQSTNPTEPGEFGVTVKAFDASNTLIGTTVTTAAGNYSFGAAVAPAGLAVRLEFTVLTGDQPSKRISNDQTNVQFVTAGPSAVNKNFAIANKKWFTSTSNPWVATSSYTNGDPNSSGSNSAGDADNLYVFPYDLSSPGSSTNRTLNKYTGAVYGMAWQRESRTLLMAAFLKRHSGFGPGGIGAIYRTTISTAGVPSNPSLLLDVTALGINVGSNPRTTALPTDSRTPNTDVGVFAEVGKRGIGGMELSVDGRDLYIVNMYEKKIQRINIGNPIKSSFSAADVTGGWVIPNPGYAGTVWHPMALEIHQGKIYVGGVSAKEVTTPSNIADTANMRGIVYEFEPVTGTFTKVLDFPLTYRRGFVNADYRYEFRNNYWQAWQNNGDVNVLKTGLNPSYTGNNANAIIYPQPMMSAIEIDVDGSMVIGLRDRLGDQGGFANYFESGNAPGENYRVLTTGEILRAGKVGSNWIIESAGSVTTDGVTTTTPGVAPGSPVQTGSYPGNTGTPWGGAFGPGGGYYYYNQNFSLTGVPAPFDSPNATYTSHYTKTNGGLALFPGHNEIMHSAIDPVNKAYTNGIIKNVNLGSNAGNMCGRMELFGSNGNNPSQMGKAAALGDIELLYDAQSMEIGNLIWYDANANGVQDAAEAGIANVTVVLRSPGADNTYNTGDDQIWTVVTDANGNYYFDETIVNDNRRPSEWIGVSAVSSGILPGFEYRVEIDPTQSALAAFSLTAKNTTNAAVDSDGSLSSGLVTVIINPGGPTAATSNVFSNDYNFDIGFSTSLLPVKQLELSAKVKDIATNQINWETVEEEAVKSYSLERSVDGIYYTTLETQLSKGNGNFSYAYTDFAATANRYFYRVLVTDFNGKSWYSKIVELNRKGSGGSALTLLPNPATDRLRLTLDNTGSEAASLSIFNATGQLMLAKTIRLTEGRNTINLDAEIKKLSAGQYHVTVRSVDNQATAAFIRR